MIIRPIPETFFGKVCLKIQKNYLESNIITKKYSVSFFGKILEVSSIAYQEQDRILSACATSSLWTYYHAHPKMELKKLPSPSKITKTSYSMTHNTERIFPNKGLNPQMIGQSLNNNGLTPYHFEFTEKDNVSVEYFFKEMIYAYCSAGIPILLGLKVEGKTIKLLGYHAVTVLGFKLSNEVFEKKKPKGGILKGSFINEIFIHDDRYGAYLPFKFIKDNEISSSQILNNNERYILETFSIGLYHKIRIPFDRVKDTCNQLIDSCLKYIKEKAENRTEPYEQLFDSIMWDIRLVDVNTLKKEILEHKNTTSSLLFKCLPKYIWKARMILSKSIEVMDLLFDATDIQQGNVFIDFFHCNENLAEPILFVIQEWAKDKYYSTFTVDKQTKNPDTYVWSIVKYFSPTHTYLEMLNELFGKEITPKKIKSQELRNNIIKSSLLGKFYKIDEEKETLLDKNLEENFTYIWLIDYEGFLCLGKEINNSNIGHPTLTDGKPARIGGNICFCKEKDLWYVDPFSGRFSFQYTEEQKIVFCQNAINLKFKVFFPNEIFELSPKIYQPKSNTR